jgi:hypothetical protein
MSSHPSWTALFNSLTTVNKFGNRNIAGFTRLGLILGGALFYTRVTFETLVVFNFKVP